MAQSVPVRVVGVNGDGSVVASDFTEASREVIT